MIDEFRRFVGPDVRASMPFYGEGGEERDWKWGEGGGGGKGVDYYRRSHFKRRGRKGELEEKYIYKKRGGSFSPSSELRSCV